MNSAVPSRFQGSWRSMAKSVVQTCGHLKSSTMAFTSNDVCRIDESPGEPLGICVAEFGYRFGLLPGFEITFPYHTKGIRPVKTPVPPRTCVERFPAAFQLNPMRGENITWVPGSFAWSTVSGFPFSSSAVRPVEKGL